MSLNDISTSISNAARSLESLNALSGAIDGLLGGSGGSAYVNQLRPASFRGVPFALLLGEAQMGRRVALHEYPFRDEVWPEDLGRAMRRFGIIGFLLGDDVIQQREQLVAAIETPGQGELIHPSFGTLQVTALPATFQERWDAGRYIEVRMTFIEWGARVFPADTPSTQDSVDGAANHAAQAAENSFIDRMGRAIKQGASAISQAMKTASAWAHSAQRIVNSATNLQNSVKNLPGVFGRYYGGRRNTLDSFLDGISGVSAAVQQAIALGAAARQAVKSATDTVQASKPGAGA